MKEANPDKLLWSTFQAGDKEAFARIYQRYATELLTYGYRVTSHRQVIKDSIHDLFLHLWLRREKLSGTDSIKFYLFRSLRNRIIRNLEKEPAMMIQPSDGVLETLAGAVSFEDILISEETRLEGEGRLRKAVEQLSARQREAITLRFHHDFSLEEIAVIMKLNNQSVRNLLHRAIVQLRMFFEMTALLFFPLSGNIF